MEMLLLPAEHVIRAFNGVRATARALGRDPSAVSRWRIPKHYGGTSGDIPAGLHRLILEKAKELGLDITPSDLIYGREIPDEESA